MNIDNFGGARFEVNYMPVQMPQKQMMFAFSAEVDNNDPSRGAGMAMMGQPPVLLDFFSNTPAHTFSHFLTYNTFAKKLIIL